MRRQTLQCAELVPSAKFRYLTGRHAFALAIFILLLSAQALALEATVSVNPTAYDATALPSSLQLSVSVRNTGNSSITGASASISGLSSAINSQTAGNPLDSTISAGASSSQSWILTPTSTGAYASSSGGADGKIIITGTQGGSVSTSEIDIPTIAVRGAVLSADASASASSVQAGSSFAVTVWINNNGYLDSAAGVSASITLPAGLSLASGSSSISAGSISPGSPASLSWTVASSSSASGTKTVSVSVSSSNAGSASDSTSVSITSPTTETPSTSTGGGQQGTVAPVTSAREARTIESIKPGSTATLAFSKSEHSVSEILLEVKNVFANVSVSVEKLDSKPASISTVEGKVYKYLDIFSNVPGANISKAKIKFRVESTWISSNNFSASTVYLNRYSSGWNRLPTSFLKSDSLYSYFESESPGFSTFAITGEKPAPAPVKEKPKPPAQPATIEPTPTGFAPVISLLSQSDIDNALKSWNSVVPQTDAARSLLERARGKISEAQTAFNNNEQARAKQLLDEAKLLTQEAAGLKSAAIAREKTSLFTVLLILVVLAVGTYAYYSRPPPRSDAGELSRLKNERGTIIQMKRNAEKEYLSRKIDQSAYKSMLAGYEGRLIEVNTRIDELSKKNN